MLGIDGYVIAVAVFELGFGYAVSQGFLAMQAIVGEVRKGVVGLVHGEGESVGAHFHAVEDAFDLDAGEQVFEAGRTDADLHEAVGASFGIVQATPMY